MPGYPYNIDPNYGPVSMIADEGKMSTPQQMIKEERIKENPSPNDNAKSQLPVIIYNQIQISQLPNRSIINFYDSLNV